MTTQAIWIAGFALEVLILWRGSRSRLRSEYFGFYLYIASVLIIEAVRFVSFRWFNGLYPAVYWNTQFILVVVGCGVIFSIYRAGLRAFPGTARMARNALLFVFAMVFAKAIVTSTDGTSWLAAVTAIKLERDLRIVQVCALVALLAVFFVYAIPMSRNLKGIIAAYGGFITLSAIQLAVMVARNENFHGQWDYFRSLSYLAALLVWCGTLWSYQAARVAEHPITLDEDYEMLVSKTRRRFQRTRLALGRAARP